jgi:hypothetical protein
LEDGKTKPWVVVAVEARKRTAAAFMAECASIVML